MAITLQWLDKSLWLHGEMSQSHLMPFGVVAYCPARKAETLQVFMPVFCIADGQNVPIFEVVPSSSG